MAKFIVKATLTKEYEIDVDAEDAMDAIKMLDGWDAEYFEEYEVASRWNFSA